MTRHDGRAPGELRPLSLELEASAYAEGSCLVSAGGTRILCTASVSDELPPWRRASGKGWVTAEYAMLPRATHTRTSRERTGARGRTQEIQRLIGRSLRAVTDLEALGPRQITVDCDVLQADGGTRTAAITGGFIALHDALTWLAARKLLSSLPIKDFVAAISVGIYQGMPLLDLDYAEDSACGCDMNVVMTGGGDFVELQGTAEGETFSRKEMDELLGLAGRGIAELIAHQRRALAL